MDVHKTHFRVFIVVCGNEFQFFFTIPTLKTAVLNSMVRCNNGEHRRKISLNICKSNIT